MKKLSINTLDTVIVLLIVISLNTSASSISFSQTNDSTLPSFTNKKPNTMEAEKINEILSMINETLVLEYLEPIVGFGPRMTGTYGCEKAA
jgi:hypothetical protein